MCIRNIYKNNTCENLLLYVKYSKLKAIIIEYIKKDYFDLIK